MARIPDAFIDDILARSDIVEIIGARVPLKRQGKEYSARCPFHDERSPSFTVSPTKQFYHCFGCGAHGTAISFLMNYDRLEFLDAVEELAKRVGMEVPRDTQQRNANPDSVDLYAAVEAASKFFQKQLAGSDRARDYFDGRGVDADIRCLACGTERQRAGRVCPVCGVHPHGARARWNGPGSHDRWTRIWRREIHHSGDG